LKYELFKSKNMKIEIWSDVDCPYCYIGFTRMQKAIGTFKFREEVELITHSFELEPDIPVNGGETQHQAVMRKYRQTSSGAQHILDQASMHATQTGLKINWDSVITTNTFDAHRLLHYAKTLGKDLELKEKIFRAYFTEGQHIGDKETLIALAAELGIEAREVVEGNEYSDEVRKDERDAQQIGVRSVPYFLFDDKYAITGAQSEESFAELLQEIWEKDNSRKIITMDQEKGCTDGSCTI